MESILTLGDAKARFSEIVEKATNGEEFIATRMGKPVVRITRFTAHGRPRKLGDFAGRIRMSEDFDDWPRLAGGAGNGRAPVRYLLDTHALLWVRAAPDLLSA